jgi:sugar phosphate isomerase/epimerase
MSGNTGNMRIGFSMHPRWMNTGNLENFIAPLYQAGLSMLEFELDNHLEDWPVFASIMESAFDIGLGLSFHAPYRSPHSLVGFAGGNCESIRKDMYPLYKIAETWAQRSSACRTVVIHAAVGIEPADKASLTADTRAFLDWVLENFPDIQLALENNHPAREGEVKVGVNPADVLSIISATSNPHLGACWDLGHDFLRKSGEEPTREWLSKVVHVHLHDTDISGLDHFPLVYGNVPYKRWLQKWKAAGGKGSVILELKGSQLKNWQPQEIAQALENSISALYEVLK